MAANFPGNQRFTGYYHSLRNWVTEKYLIRVLNCSARLVSTTVAVDIDSPSQSDTTWVMQYGQFIDHDFTRTPEFKMGTTSKFQSGEVPKFTYSKPFFKPMEALFRAVCRMGILSRKS
jgi:hypothetical protein